MKTQTKSFPFQRTIRPLRPDETGKGKHTGVQHFEINCLMCDARWFATEKQTIRLFCGNDCKYASLALEYRGEDHFKRSGQWLECRVCEKRYWVKQSRVDVGKGSSCSRECYEKEHPSAMKYPDVVRNCLHCGDEFTCKESDKTQHCSVKCGVQASYDTGRHPPMNGRNNGRFGRPSKYMKYDLFTDRLGRSFRMRSSYEIAFVEQCLDPLEMTWDYESKTFDLGTTTYTPDFWIEEMQAFVEVKGYMREKTCRKIELFKQMNTAMRLIVATQDVLRENFKIDLSKEVIKNIQERYNAKTYVRIDQREIT